MKKKNRLFCRIYSEGERILEQCWDFPFIVSLYEGQKLLSSIDKAADEMKGSTTPDLPEVPETEEPALKLYDDTQKVNFHILLPEGRRGEMSMHSLKASVGEFLVLTRHDWDGSLQVRTARKEDYALLGEAAPPLMMLEEAAAEAEETVKKLMLPRNLESERGGDTAAQKIRSLVNRAFYNYDCEQYKSLQRYYEKLKELAEQGIEEEMHIDFKERVKVEAERQNACFGNCAMRTMPERKRNAICKKCRRNYKDMFKQVETENED